MACGGLTFSPSVCACVRVIYLHYTTESVRIVGNDAEKTEKGRWRQTTRLSEILLNKLSSRARKKLTTH